jgi:hypothetical protein
VAAEGIRGVLTGYQKFFFLPSGVKLSTIIIEPNLRRGFKMRFRVYKSNSCCSIDSVVYSNFSHRFYSIIERYYSDSPSEVQFLSMIKGPKYNNKWIFEIIGVEMLESFNGVSIRNVDTSLIKGMVAAFLSMNGYIVFYPYANGVYDYNLKDVPDWKFVNDYLCISLHLDMPDKTGDYREYCGNYGEIKIKVMRDEKN